MKKAVSLLMLLFICSASYADFDKELYGLWRRHRAEADAKPNELLKAWDEFVTEYSEHDRIIEAIYPRARITSVYYSEEYLPYVKDAVEKYRGNTKHIYYIRMLNCTGSP